MNKRLQVIVFAILLISILIINSPKEASAETVVVKANEAWQLTGIILKKNHVI